MSYHGETTLNDNEDIDCSREQIDMEINTLAESIRALKTRRNALSEISCLPAENLKKFYS